MTLYQHDQRINVDPITDWPIQLFIKTNFWGSSSPFIRAIIIKKEKKQLDSEDQMISQVHSINPLLEQRACFLGGILKQTNKQTKNNSSNKKNKQTNKQTKPYTSIFDGVDQNWDWLGNLYNEEV